MESKANVGSFLRVVGDGDLVAFVDDLDGLVAGGGDHVDHVVGEDKGAAGIGGAGDKDVVDGDEGDTLVLIKVADLLHLFANLDLEVAVEDAVGEGQLGADGDDAHSAVGGFDALSKGGPILDGDTVDHVGGAEFGGGGSHAFDGLDEDVGRERFGDLEGKATHVKTASGERIPIDVSLTIYLFYISKNECIYRLHFFKKSFPYVSAT